MPAVVWPYTNTAFNAPARYSFDVTNYGAKGDGTTNDAAAINAAATAAGNAPGGGEVYFPPGTYRVQGAASIGLLRPKSNTIWRGASRALTVILYDDTTGGTDCVGNNINNGATWDPLSNWAMRGITLRGYALTNRTAAGQLMRIKGDNISIDDCGFEYSRNMGMVLTGCRNVSVRNCKVYRTIADGIAVWDSSEVLIESNDIVQANDDAISAHSNDTTAAPVRSGVNIVNNRITESQGIAVLGLKNVVIDGNILKRIMGTGIRVRAPDSDVQGQSPQFAAQITRNNITDVFKRNETSPRNGSQFYILLSGGTRRNGSGAVPPGEIDPATGTWVSLYGSAGTGTLYANETGAGGAAMPAARAIIVEGNVLQRTLPAVTTVSQWGYPDSASGLWVGNNGDGSGFFNGAIPEANLNTDGIQLEGALWDSSISRNIINTSGSCGIKFLSTVAATHMDFNNLAIDGNQISNVSDACIRLPNATTTQRMFIRGNILDGDPFHIHSNRKTGPRDGSWLANGAPYGIWANTSSGIHITDNHFRNVANTVENQGYALPELLRNNYVYCDPGLQGGFSTTNKGVGTLYRTGQFFHIHEDCNPTSATYGRIQTNPVTHASAQPTTGSWVLGTMVLNWSPSVAAGKILVGWLRLTTGSGNVAGTDWTPIYCTNT